MVIDVGLAAQAVFLKMWEGMSWEAQMKMLGLVRDPNGCFLNICWRNLGCVTVFILKYIYHFGYPCTFSFICLCDFVVS